MSLLVVYYIIFSGFLIYCSNRDHLLSTLLSLEYMVLAIFFSLLVHMGGSFSYYSFIYLVVAACEGALGLSVLVTMSRTHGGDYFKSLNFLFY